MKEITKQNFKNNKIVKLNNYFMKSTIYNFLFSLLIFFFSILAIVFFAFGKNVDSGLKVSLISMGSTFIITTSKSIIDKILDITKFYSELLAEEQRAFNNSIGIEMEKVKFETDSCQDDAT